MIQRDEMAQILRFIAGRWNDVASDPASKPMEGLPSGFWMNSVGGRTAKGGYWVTTALYTESAEDAEAFKQVLFRWQAKGNNDGGGPDLIQIGKKK